MYISTLNFDIFIVEYNLYTIWMPILSLIALLVSKMRINIFVTTIMDINLILRSLKKTLCSKTFTCCDSPLNTTDNT